MVLSTQTDKVICRFGDFKAVEMVAAAGFDAVDYSMFIKSPDDVIYTDGYKEHAEKLRKTAEVNGVYFNQAHAAFPTMRDGDDKFNAERMKRVKREIEVAGILGVKNIVVHPVYFKENRKQKNLDMYNELLPTAKAAGVRIALENMWKKDENRGCIIHSVCSSAEELAEYRDCLDDERFTVLADLGHVILVGENEEHFIKTLGHRLQCLHVHDVSYTEDTHTLPFTHGTCINWEEVTKALKAIDYKGDLTLEADRFLNRLPDELIPSGLKFMHDTGRHIIKMIEGAE